MTTAVDTNVLFDILQPASRHFDASKRAILMASESGGAIVGEVAYAEVAGQFADSDDADRFLDEAGITLVASSSEALYRGGTAWQSYARNRRGAYRCQVCAEDVDVACPKCGAPVTRRQHVIADFMIGAHALVHAGRLLTRAHGYFGTYFPDLELV